MDMKPRSGDHPGTMTEPRRPERFGALDVLRGFVMVLMTIDHASGALNRNRLFTDSAMFWTPHSPLPAGQFFTRWITHLCAPTFVFLAGVSLAIAVESRRARGASERAIDRYVLSRGLVLIAIEVVWMSPVMLEPGRFLFQVLYALGTSLVAMALLRRLGDRALLAGGVAVVLGAELLLGGAAALGVARSLPAAMTVSGGFFFGRKLIVAYPTVPWLGMMMLGWVLGRWLVARRAANEVARVPRVLGMIGAAMLAGFVVLRGVDRYGNMMLHRDDGSLVHWLHVSKYPPSVTFTCLELGIAFVLLAALFAITRSRPDFGGPLRLLGQVALFFYVLHIHLLHLGANVLGVYEKLDLRGTYLGAAITLVVLYPACLWYRRYKAAHPDGWARFL
jgi:uncharacterized membrane protein